MEETFSRVWRLNDTGAFEKVERDTLLVNFGSQMDKERVVEGGPWTFEGTALLIQQWEPGMSGEDFECKTINSWVRLYKLPFEYRRKEYAIAFAGLAGAVIEKITYGEGHNGDGSQEYMQVRVKLDITNPIMQGFFLRREGRRPLWIPMKYVKLPNLCFTCGRFTHETRLCRIHSTGQEKEFGNWLRADDRSMRNPVWSKLHQGHYTKMTR